MTYNFFLTLVLAVGFISTAPNLLNTGTATWDHPKRVAAHPELYKRTNEGKVYDPAKVISAMGKIDEGLKILTAHRGISGPKCPENSKCSVKATVDAGIESVEIDVYSDKNGNLWPLHDRRIGRVTSYLAPKSPRYPRGKPYFNPSHDAPSGINNPLLSDLDTTTLQSLHLRDINGASTEYYFEDLKALLTYIKQLGVLAVVLDMRKKEEIITAVKLIQSLGMTTITAIKCQVGVITPYESDIGILGGIGFIPVQYPGGAEVIAANFKGFEGNHESVIDYDMLYQRYPNFLYFEPSTKMFDDTEEIGWWPAGPTAFVQVALNEKEIPMGTYILTPNVPQGYFDPDGHCCGQPNDWLFNSIYFGDETRDDRGKYEVMVTIYNVLTCDNILPILDLATKYGYRKNLYRIQR